MVSRSEWFVSIVSVLPLPLNCDLYRIPNLEADKQGPVVALKARSLLPYCHFELEDSDYIRGARRNPELRGPHGAPAGTTLDPNTRVLEMSTVGVGVTSRRSFYIVNPTNSEYGFEWVNDDEPNLKHEPHFTCLTTSGSIRPGKKTQVDFEFTSSSLELVESFWKFVIPKQNITVPFLLVGQTNDPNVAFERSHLNFKALLIGESQSLFSHHYGSGLYRLITFCVLFCLTSCL